MRRAILADLLLIAAVAVAANFAYLVYSNGDYYFPDSATYLAPAHALLQGRGFSGADGTVETLRTPGYPLFLLPFLAAGWGAIGVLAAQHLVNVLLAIGIYLFMLSRARPWQAFQPAPGAQAGKPASHDRAPALLAALLFALDTPTIHYANKVLSETLFTLLLFAIFAAALRMRSADPRLGHYLLAGIATGFLVLVRPVAILYFVVLALFLLRRNSIRAVAVFTLAALIIPFAWGVRNYARIHVFTISSVAGVNMLLHRAAPSIAISDGGPFKDDLRDRQQELLEDANDHIEEAEHVDAWEDVPQAIRASYYSRIGSRIALEHPFGLTLVTARGILVNLFDADADAMVIVSRVSDAVVVPLLVAWSHALVFLAAIGGAWLWTRDRSTAVLLAATIAYFVVISAGSEAESRFRVPITPQLAIAAGASVSALRRIRIE